MKIPFLPSSSIIHSSHSLRLKRPHAGQCEVRPAFSPFIMAWRTFLGIGDEKDAVPPRLLKLRSSKWFIMFVVSFAACTVSVNSRFSQTSRLTPVVGHLYVWPGMLQLKGHQLVALAGSNKLPDCTCHADSPRAKGWHLERQG